MDFPLKILEDKRKFLEITKDLTIYQQALLANRSIDTIDTWKNECNFPKGKKPPGDCRLEKINIDHEEVPEDWDNKEWLTQAYAKYGMPTLARMVGAPNAPYIEHRLKRLDIPTKSLLEATKPKHECCSEEWLYYHYSRREEYLEWCKRNDIEPDEHGGQSLSVKACSELAGVVQQTIVNWMTRFKMRIRDHREACSGELHPNFGKRASAAERRICRCRFFEDYRAGKSVIIIGPYIFSNGKFLGTRKTVAAKGLKNIRGQPRY